MANQPTKYSKFLVGAASAALVASAVAPVANAADFSDVKGNTHEDAINTLVALGAISGYPDGSFQPNKELTRSDVVKMMGKYLVALDKGFKIPEDAKTVQRFDDLPVTANEELVQYAALVHDAGVFQGSNGKLLAGDKITRENMALVLVRAFDAILDRDLVAEVAATKDFKKEVTDLAAAKAEARGAIEVLDFLDITTVAQFNPKGKTTRGHFATFLNNTIKAEAEGKLPAKIEAPVTTATKVEAVTATNLKEVVVTFDGTVDAETATDKANYSLKSGKTIDSVAISADEKTVTLTLVGELVNNKVEALSVSGVNAGDKTIDEKNIEFTPADNAVPTVTEVKSLGTKSLKVVFSEPVDDVQQANFTLDGKAYFGKVTTVGNEVILTPYDSAALAVGEHTILVEKVKDFAGFTSLRSSHNITVVEDKDAPTIVEAKATLEKVTIKFSEDIDMDTVAASNVYWKSGSDKKAAESYKRLSSTEFEFTFEDTDSLPTGNVDVFVEGVKDYSGNAIAKDSKVSVSPVVDQTRPEVKKVTALTATTFEVKFSKVVLGASAELASNYTVLDKDGKVIPVQKAEATGDTVKVTLYSALSTGTNKVTVKNVKDKTKLQNTMLDFSGTIVVGDTTGPNIDSKTANENKRTLVIGFNEKMDVATLADYSNYLVDIGGTLQVLTSSVADISVQQDGKVVVITFVEKIDGKDVKFSSPGAGEVQVNTLQVLGVKDLAGNLLSNFTTSTGNTIDLDDVANNNPIIIEKATLVNTKTVELKLNAGIVSAPKSAITGPLASKVSSIEVNGTSTIKVKFTEEFAVDKSDVDFTIDPSKLVTLAGNGPAGTLTVANAAVIDKVAPSIIATTPITLKVDDEDIIVVTLDENINDAALSLLASDLEIRVNGTLLNSYDFSVATGTANDNKFEIKVTKAGVKSNDVTVTLVNDRYLQDVAGNTVNLFANKKLTVATGKFLIEQTPATVITKLPKAATLTANGTHTLVFSEAIDTASKDAVKAAVDAAYVAGGTATVTSAWNTAGTTLTVTVAGADALGTNQVVVSAISDIAVTDILGNTSATLEIQIP
ncbi:S-layer homology domain-containing protein [Sporosarcina sp. YIM B06819]|uniref:S-layer homology domain-containing protein n=1 Tax=Sporosarcina sp. YIM B06819 TaxID=3081769 RepID=UPI00298D0DEF|nr:S-layer homology domain-containing protein [Sporosarcina sp. YIM B06819]